MAEGSRDSSWGNKKVLKFIVMDVQLRKYTKQL